MTALELRNEKLKQEAIFRKNEYNKNPHLCKFCNTAILMNENDKYNDIFRKKFCSLSCASKYGHKTTDKFRTSIIKPSRIEDDFSDDELITFYNDSQNIKELENKIGYKNILSQNRVINRFLNLGLDINKLKEKDIQIESLSKRELFARYTQWQTARSTIQKNARNVYFLSNKPKQCVCCGYDKHFEVAHIKAVSDFEDDALISEINNEDNLIALCPNHHWEYDNTDFDITQYLNCVS